MYGEALHEDPDPKEIFDLGLERPLSDKPFTGPNVLPDEIDIQINILTF